MPKVLIRNIKLADKNLFDGINLDERINEKEGIIKDVKLVGLTSDNGYDYSLALPDAAHLFEDAPIYWKPHRLAEGETREEEEIVAFVKDARYVDGEGLRGDLHFFTTDPRYPKIIEYVKKFTSLIGLSQDSKGDGYRDEDTGIGYVQKFTQVNELILCKNPAATTHLFDSKGKNRMKTRTITSIVSGMKLGSNKRKLCFHFLEQVDPSVGETEVEAKDAEDEEKGAIKGLVDAVLNDTELDAAQMVEKLKGLLDSFGKIEDSEEEEKLEDSDDEESLTDEEEKEKALHDTDDKDLKDSLAKMNKRLDRVETKDTILALLDSAQVEASDEIVSELTAIPAKMRKKYLQRIKPSLKDAKPPKISGSVLSYEDEEDEEASFLDSITN